MGVEGIGASVVRKEDKRFITGKGRYVDDVKLLGMTHAHFNTFFFFEKNLRVLRRLVLLASPISNLSGSGTTAIHRVQGAKSNSIAGKAYFNGKSTNLPPQASFALLPGLPETVTSSPAIFRSKAPGPSFTSACVAESLIFAASSNTTLSN